MKRKDPNSGNSIGERRTGAKVVQLPREWLGPTDELVPFGVSADDPPPPTSISPPSAQSFWTEDAASLHAALQGAPPPNDHLLDAEAELGHSEEIPLPAADSDPTRAPRSKRARLPRRPRRRPSPRPRAVPALIVSGLALGLIAVIGSMLGSAHRPTAASGSGARLITQTADLGRNAADWRLLARVKQTDVGRTHPSKPASKSFRAGRPRHSSRHAARGAAPSGAGRAVVSYHSAATAQPVTTSPATPQTPATTYQPTVSSARQTAASSTSNPAKPSPASLLGPGHCACG